MRQHLLVTALVAYGSQLLRKNLKAGETALRVLQTMFRQTVHHFVLCVSISSVLFASGCCEAPQDRQSTGVSPHISPELVDSPENRLSEAKKCVEAYPAAEFAAELTEQATDIVGREVAEDIRARLRQRLSAAEFRKIRIQLLVQTFSTRELAQLRDIYRTSGGRSLMKKLASYNEDWRKFFTPVILEVLSNKPQQ